MVLVKMSDRDLSSPEDIKSFFEGCENLKLQILKSDCYDWIGDVLKRTGYISLKRQDKGVVFKYLEIMTGLSRQQISRLLCTFRKQKCIVKKKYQRHVFTKRYTRDDILLLAQTDEYHQTLSGGATKKLFERGLLIYQDKRYERLAYISIAHIYNLRESKTYLLRRHHFEKTKKRIVSIGERRKPTPNGEPGYIRIDTVHQGDFDGKKGVYHINAVDEVTQYEVICSVEGISERYLIPVLETLLITFPFTIKGFHSDNGSEYVNHTVAKLLNKLQVEFTKSRSRHSNDNALVEGKNGAIVRKILGYVHIAQKWAEVINEFNQTYWVPYINFHRPCFFAEEKINEKGKIKKIYQYENMATPYEKLKSLPNAEGYLKSGVCFAKLDKEAMQMTDLESAKQLSDARSKLFQQIFTEKEG